MEHSFIMERLKGIDDVLEIPNGPIAENESCYQLNAQATGVLQYEITCTNKVHKSSAIEKIGNILFSHSIDECLLVQN